MKLRAALVTASSTAAKNAAVRANSPHTAGTAHHGTPPANSTASSPTAYTVTVMASRFAAAVSTATAHTAQNLPSSSASRLTGAAISVSSVPRSRSPAVESIAGYTAPVAVMSSRISGMTVARLTPSSASTSTASVTNPAGGSGSTPAAAIRPASAASLKARSRSAIPAATFTLSGDPARVRTVNGADSRRRVSPGDTRETMTPTSAAPSRTIVSTVSPSRCG